jgi:hypothetical protein
LPPVADFVALLSSSIFDEGGAFSIVPETDYEDLGYLVQILSAALSDLDDYVEAERAEEAKLAPPPVHQDSPEGGSPSKGKERPKTPLETMRMILDSLHGKIRAQFLSVLDGTDLYLTTLCSGYSCGTPRSFSHQGSAATFINDHILSTTGCSKIKSGPRTTPQYPAVLHKEMKLLLI